MKINTRSLISFQIHIVGSVVESGISKKYVFEKNDFKVWDYNTMLWQQ